MTPNRLGLFKTTVIALVVVLLNFSSQIATFLDDQNRYFFQWNFLDGLSMVLDVILLAGLAVAISQLLHALKWDRVRRVYNHVFLLTLAAGALSLLPPRILRPYPESSRYDLTWLGVAGIIGFSLGYAKSRLVEYGGKLCLIFSPLVIILFCQVLVQGSWSTGPEPLPDFQASKQQAGPAAAARTPIFFFVFDEWSYTRSTQEDEFLSSLTHINDLSAQSFNFRQAWCPSNQTMYSLPALIYQTDYFWRVEKTQTFWEINNDPVPSAQVPSIFKPARDHGYNTALIGFYLPYRKILADQVDYCRSWYGFPKGDNLPRSMMMTALRNCQYLTDPVTKSKRESLQASVESKWWFDMNNEILEESLRFLEECPHNTFAFFHWPLPHGPFVFNPDGTYRGPYTGRGGKFPGLHGTPEDYQNNLLYLDVVIGRIVERLKASGKFDDAMLIMTGDHAWRMDPLGDFSISWKQNPFYRQVPLLIKIPGQKYRHVIDKDIYNHHIQPLIDLVLGDNVTERKMVELIEGLPAVCSPKEKATPRFQR